MALASKMLANNRINLKLLHTFMAVAEHRSFREAADQIGRSQSAISMQIKQLEEQIGISLFNRTTRAVRMTPEGEQLFDYASRAVNEIEFGLRNIQEIADVRRGLVVIACAPTLAATRLPPILARFQHIHPGIRVVLHELKSKELFERLRHGEMDFAVAPIVGDGDFEFRQVIAEPIHVVATDRFIGHDGPSMPFAEIADLPLILFPSTTVLGQLVAEEARRQDIKLNIRYECIQGQTLIALAKAGLGAALTTATLATLATGDPVPGLRRPRLADPDLTQAFGIAKLKGKSLSAAAGHLAALIETELASSWPPESSDNLNNQQYNSN